MLEILRALTGQNESIPDVPIPLRANASGELLTAGGGASVPLGLIDNLSGTITLGGTSQQVSGVEDFRRMLIIQNPSTETEPLYYDFGRASTIDDNSLELAPGQAALIDLAIPTTTLTVNATTTGHRFFIRQGRIAAP